MADQSETRGPGRSANTLLRWKGKLYSVSPNKVRAILDLAGKVKDDEMITMFVQGAGTLFDLPSDVTDLDATVKRIREAGSKVA